MFQFGTIKVRRTFENYLIEKKVTIIVAFHFMKRLLITNRNLINPQKLIANILLKTIAL